MRHPFFHWFDMRLLPEHWLVGVRRDPNLPDGAVALLVVVRREGEREFISGALLDEPVAQDATMVLLDHANTQGGPPRVISTDGPALAAGLRAALGDAGVDISLHPRLPQIDGAVQGALTSACETLRSRPGPDPEQPLEVDLDASLVIHAMHRWPSPRAAERRYYGRRDGPRQLEPESITGAAQLAFLTWVTTFRRPRRTSRTVVEDILDVPGFYPIERDYFAARAAAVPTVRITRQIDGDGWLLEEDVFTGRLFEVHSPSLVEQTSPGFAQIGILVPVEDRVASYPLAPPVEESGLPRLMEFFAREGIGREPESRVANAHKFGRLWFLDTLAP